MEIKYIHFNTTIRTVSHCRTIANTEHTTITLTCYGNAHCIYPIRRNQLIRIIHPKICSRKTYFTTDTITTYYYAIQEIIISQAEAASETLPSDSNCRITENLLQHPLIYICMCKNNFYPQLLPIAYIVIKTFTTVMTKTMIISYNKGTYIIMIVEGTT